MFQEIYHNSVKIELPESKVILMAAIRHFDGYRLPRHRWTWPEALQEPPFDGCLNRCKAILRCSAVLARSHGSFRATNDPAEAGVLICTLRGRRWFPGFLPGMACI
jgi:hypothetical protein